MLAKTVVTSNRSTAHRQAGGRAARSPTARPQTSSQICAHLASPENWQGCGVNPLPEFDTNNGGVLVEFERRFDGGVVAVAAAGCPSLGGTMWRPRALNP